MGEGQSLSFKNIMLWSVASALLLLLLAKLCDSPCDKPICLGDSPAVSNQVAEQQVTTSEQPVGRWETPEGLSVNYVFKPSSSELLITLRVEPELNEGGSAQQVMELKLNNKHSQPPDLKSIAQVFDALGPKYSPVYMSISIEGDIEESQAQKLAETLSQTVHQAQKTVDNFVEH